MLQSECILLSVLPAGIFGYTHTWGIPVPIPVKTRTRATGTGFSTGTARYTQGYTLTRTRGG